MSTISWVFTRQRVVGDLASCMLRYEEEAIAAWVGDEPPFEE